MKFLTNFVVFTNIPCSFLLDILSCDVPVSHDLVTDVFARVLPRQEITAELHSTSYFFFLNKESKSTCFTQPRVSRMSAELQIVAVGVVFTRFQHVLKSVERLSQQKVIITVTQALNEDQ